MILNRLHDWWFRDRRKRRERIKAELAARRVQRSWERDYEGERDPVYSDDETM